MNPADAERWKELERRARERGWTIDSLAVHADRPVSESAMSRRAFALVELSGDERVLATGDLDAIEAFLKSSHP